MEDEGTGMKYQIYRIEKETRSAEQWSGGAVERWKCCPALFLWDFWSLRLLPERVVSAYGIAESSMLPGEIKVAKYKLHFYRRIAFIKQAEHR
jgi:hypothetical protein